METLVKLRLWPATPCSPTLGFTWDLLLLLQSLMFECHVSVYDYVKHLCFYKEPLCKDHDIYEQLLDSFEEFRYHLKAQDSCHLSDGNLVVKASPVTCLACPISAQDCSDFHAGSAIHSKGRYVALDETAVFGLTCRHAIPWKFVNIKGGERIGYMVFMMIKLLDSQLNQFENKQIRLMYDICCQLEKHLKNKGCNDLLDQFHLGCPQFHAYGHGADCQVRFSPRRLPGWGLCDGEVMERMWSYLGRFKKMTKEMSSSHREDILSDALYFYALHARDKIIPSLLRRLKEALKQQKEAKDNLQEIQDTYGVTLQEETLQLWQKEQCSQLQKRQPQTVNLGQHTWVIEYFNLLRKFYALRERVILEESDSTSEKQLSRISQCLVEIERNRGIKERWKPSDQLFQSALVSSEASKATSLLDMIRMSGRQRWFLLSLIKKYADGQAQSKRILKAITKESKALGGLLKRYNACVQILKEHGRPFMVLSWRQATDVATSQIYLSRPQAECPPSFIQSADFKREVLEAYNLLQRSGEEISAIKGEMAGVLESLSREHVALEARICELRTCTVDDAIASGLISILTRKLWRISSQKASAVKAFESHIDTSLFISTETDLDSSSVTSGDVSGWLEEVDELDDDIEEESEEDDTKMFLFNDDDSGFVSMSS